MIIIASYTNHDKAIKSVTLLLQEEIEASLAQYHENGVQIFNLEVPDVFEEKARKLITSFEMEKEVDSDFMTEFTNQELKDILIEADSYNAVMVINAKTLLKSRLPDFHISDLNEDKESQRQKALIGESASSGHLALGYISALLGGLIGIAIGWFLETGKTKSIHGEHYTYDIKSRKQGKIIKWVGILAMILWAGYRIFGY